MRRIVLGMLPLLSACVGHVFSPPGRVLPLETAATLAPGQTAVQASGGYHSETLGPTITTGTLQVRHSLGEGAEGVIEGNLLRVIGTPNEDIDPNIYALRLGAKRRLTPWLALTTGLGGGISAGGGFLSPDLGAVASYENRYLTPFLSVRGMYSLPINPQVVDVSSAGAPEPDLQRPQQTYGLSTAVGFKVPFLLGNEADMFQGAFLAGAGMSWLVDRAEEAVYGETRIGLEMNF